MSTTPAGIPASLDKLAETPFPERPTLTTHKPPKFRLLARLPPRRPPVTVQRHTRSDSVQSGSNTSGAGESETKTQEVPVPKRKGEGNEVEIVHETVTVRRRIVRWTLTIVDDEGSNKRQKVDSGESESESESEDDSEDESDSGMQSPALEK